MDDFRKPDRLIAGQAYWKGEQVAHTKLDGSKTTLQRWKSFCAECGVAFTFTTPMEEPKYLSRRCSEHAARGKPVNGKRKRSK